MSFKNNIRHGGRRWQHIAEDVPGISSLSGLFQAEWRRFPVGSFPSNPPEFEDDVLKSFPLGIPKGKSHMGLNLVTVPATPRLPLKRSNAQGTFPSERTSCCVSCGPVLLKPHMFSIHIVQFGAQKGLQHFNVPVGGRSYCCTTFLKNVRADHTTAGICTPNNYARRVEWPFLEFTRVTFSPVAKFCLFTAPLIWE